MIPPPRGGDEGLHKPDPAQPGQMPEPAQLAHLGSSEFRWGLMPVPSHWTHLPLPRHSMQSFLMAA